MQSFSPNEDMDVVIILRSTDNLKVEVMTTKLKKHRQDENYYFL